MSHLELKTFQFSFCPAGWLNTTRLAYTELAVSQRRIKWLYFVTNLIICAKVRGKIFQGNCSKVYIHHNVEVIGELLTEFAQGHVRDHLNDGTPQAGLLSSAVDALKRQTGNRAGTSAMQT